MRLRAEDVLHVELERLPMPCTDHLRQPLMPPVTSYCGNLDALIDAMEHDQKANMRVQRYLASDELARKAQQGQLVACEGLALTLT